LTKRTEYAASPSILSLIAVILMVRYKVFVLGSQESGDYFYLGSAE